MCGIAGIYNLGDSKRFSFDELNRMVAALQHRGPDECGVYLDDEIGLGSTRLSIVDLTGGTQPLTDEHETSWIVYNGEIFNYPELKECLRRQGHRFKTSTDTEVLLHLYQEKGKSCLQDLNGQFAFAIWNASEQELFLARDRTGERPLYYNITNGRFIFASEIKAIFALNAVPRQMEPLALDQIFTFWTTLPGNTAFVGVKELPPGHYLKISRGKMAIGKYWDIPFCVRDEQLDWPVAALGEKIQDLLADAVKIRMRADVPVGCYLSGGLDSSIVTALMKQNGASDLRTFSLRFEEKAFDEGEFQNEMVAFAKTIHTNVEATNQQIGEFLPAAIWHGETPLMRTSPAPLYLLSRAVNQSGLKVVLTGEGADEVFGGYDIFREAKVRHFWAKKPESKFRRLLLGRLHPYILHDPKLKGVLHSFFENGITEPGHPFFSHLIRWQNTSRAKIFFSADLTAATQRYDGYEELGRNLPKSFARWDYLAKAQFLETKLFLSNFLLSAQGDRMAMAHAVETRMPFLDHRLVEFMAGVPAKWKIKGLQEKYFLKKIFKQALPEKIITRQKYPYRAPIKPALLHENSPVIREMLSPGSLNETGLFDAAKVQRLLQKLEKTPQTSEVDGMALTGIVSSQLVYERFIKKPAETACPKIHFSRVIDRRSERSC